MCWVRPVTILLLVLTAALLMRTSRCKTERQRAAKDPLLHRAIKHLLRFESEEEGEEDVTVNKSSRANGRRSSGGKSASLRTPLEAGEKAPQFMLDLYEKIRSGATGSLAGNTVRSINAKIGECH